MHFIILCLSFWGISCLLLQRLLKTLPSTKTCFLETALQPLPVHMLQYPGVCPCLHHAAESDSTTSFREQCSYTLLSCPKHLLLHRRKPETLTCLLLLPCHQYLKHHPPLSFSSVRFSSVAQSCPTLCDPMNRTMPGLPVHHQFPEFSQTHVHRVSDAIQPSHPLSSPSPPAPNPSKHQSLFQ